MAVAFGRACRGAFVGLGADNRGGFGLDQFLHHETYGVSDQVHTVTGAERVEKLGQGRLWKSHRMFSLGVCSCRNTPRITPMAHPWVDTSNTPEPDHPRGRLRVERASSSLRGAGLLRGFGGALRSKVRFNCQRTSLTDWPPLGRSSPRTNS